MDKISDKSVAKVFKYFDRAINSDPTDSLAYTNKGNALSNLKKYTEAISYFDKALHFDKNNAYAFNGKGHALKNLAKECYEKANKLNPNLSYSLKENSNRIKPIDKVLDNQLKKTNSQPMKQQIEDSNLYFIKNAHKSSDKLIDTSKLNKINGQPVEYVGNADVTIKFNSNPAIKAADSIDNKLDKKIQTNQTILNKTNQNDLKSQLSINLSKINKSFQMSDRSKAPSELASVVYSNIDHYERSIELNPQDPASYYNKGNALRNLKKYNEAIVCYDKAIQLDPNDSSVHFVKGDCLFDLYKYTEAVVCYDKAIELNPNLSLAYSSKGNALFHLNKINEAIECHDKAIQLNPNYAQAYHNKGVILYHLKKYQESIDCYEKAISINPNYVVSYIGIGNIFRNLNRSDEAIQCYDYAIHLDPYNSFAKQRRTELLSQKIN